MTITTFVSGLTSTGGITTDETYLFISDSNGISQVKISDQTQTNFTGMGNGGKIELYGNYIYHPSMDQNFTIIRIIYYDYTTLSADYLEIRFNTIETGMDEFGNSQYEYIGSVVGLVGVEGYLYCVHSSGYISRIALSTWTPASQQDESNYDYHSNDWGFGSATATGYGASGFRDLGGALTGASPSSLASDGSTYIYIGCSSKIVKMGLDGTSYGSIVTGLSSAVSALSVSGNYLYALLDDTVLKINLTDSSSSELISSGLTTPNSMVNSGDYLYICDGESVLRSTLTAGGSSDSSLSSLTVDSEPVTGYSITVGADTTSISVAAIPNDSNAQSVTINGDTVSSPTYSTSVSISYGSTGSTDIPIVVMAEDGSSTSYTLTVTMSASSITTLSEFKINNTDMGSEGEITVSYGTEVSVYVATTSSYAYIDINGDSQITGTKTRTFTGLSVGTHIVTVHIVPQDEGAGAYYYATVIVTSAASITCFEENTKILCFNSEKSEEEYVMVKDLRKGHLVKTFASGYKPIDMIGKRDIYHPAVEERIKNQLYKCSNDKYPEIFEDLVITGCHCILVRGFTSDEQKEKSIELNGDLYITDNRYRLPACIDDKSTVYEEAGNYTIYHLALENDDYYMNYGIYANGLLVETCSKRYLKEVSGMDLLE